MVSPKLLARQVADSYRAHGIDVQAIYLFGSHARGEARRDSDIDLLIVTKSLRGRTLWGWSGLAAGALRNIQEPIQIHPITPEDFARPDHGSFLEAIRPDLKLLYRQRRRARRTAAARP